MTTVVVVLHPAEPTEELELLLNDPAYLGRVFYVKGSPMSARHLAKVRIEEAEACFVLTR